MNPYFYKSPTLFSLGFPYTGYPLLHHRQSSSFWLHIFCNTHSKHLYALTFGFSPSNPELQHGQHEVPADRDLRQRGAERAHCKVQRREQQAQASSKVHRQSRKSSRRKHSAVCVCVSFFQCCDTVAIGRRKDTP